MKEAIERYKRPDVQQKWEELESLTEVQRSCGIAGDVKNSEVSYT